MTLKDKFEQWFINDEEDEHYEGMVDKVAIEHEKIADEFAIGFAYWYEWRNDRAFKTFEELLEIYKKEKRL